jgi:hypothetical protein
VIGNGELEHWTDEECKARTTKKIVASGVGPDLRFTVATIERAKRRTPVPSSQHSGGAGEEPF